MHFPGNDTECGIAWFDGSEDCGSLPGDACIQQVGAIAFEAIEIGTVAGTEGNYQI